MENTIRVLGIAPYEGMKTAMESLKSEYPQMELTILVGDLESGLEAARQNFHGNYDVVISRGGTAKILQQNLSLPVIEIEISLYDVLCALRLSGKTAERIAVVSLAEFGFSVQSLGELLGYDVDVRTVSSRGDVVRVLREVQKENYAAVLCDMIANTEARKLEMNSYLIVSGTDSLRQAFDRAVHLCGVLERARVENDFLRQIISGQISNSVVFDRNGALYLSTVRENVPELTELLRQEIPETLLQKQRRFHRTLNSVVYTIEGREILSGGGSYTAFFFTGRRTPLSAGQAGITYFTRPEVEKAYYGSVFSIAKVAEEHREQVEKLTGSRTPLMITGEDGTGKESLAHQLYLHSTLKNSSFIRVDCSQLNDKAREFLSGHSASPLADEGNTLFFCNIAVLTPSEQRQLLSMLTDMDVCRRNRVIFSCRTDGDAPQSAASLFADSLCCFTMTIPPLRERAEKIPALLTIMLSHLNAELSQQILGVEPAAAELLQKFDWPRNYLQFRRVIGELAASAETSVITFQQVSKALRSERHTGSFRPAAEDSAAPLDLSRPLSEITRDIAFRVVEETDGNQSAAAKRLGISRTTLWRLLKE